MKDQISTYIINLPHREDRKTAVLEQFKGKEEFDVHVFPAFEEQRGAWGLWKSIVAIVKRAKADDLDAVLICEDDHEFTTSYDYDSFFSDIHTAADLGCEVLLGGIGGLGNVVPVKDDLLWTDWFWCTQFMVVFHEAFDTILNADFDERKDVADEFLAKLLTNKMVVYPFISTQHETGYSDVTAANNRQGTISSHFLFANRKIQSYLRVFNKYGTAQGCNYTRPKNIPPHPYLLTTDEPKLHVGCGPFIKDGWLNVDLKPQEGAYFMDAGREMPFPDSSFQYIHSEHLLEHLDYLQGGVFLSESHRVLKKGGVLRLALPNLQFLIDLHQNPTASIHRRYVEWCVGQYMPWILDDFIKKPVPASIVINHYMHAWGHKTIYDKELLFAALEKAGFEDIQLCEIGQSEHPALSGQEQHGNMIPAWANRLETMVIEAVK